MANGNGGGMFGIRPPQTQTISSEGGLGVTVARAFLAIVSASICLASVIMICGIIGPALLFVAGFVAILALVTAAYWFIVQYSGKPNQQTDTLDVNGWAALGLGAIAITIGAWWWFSGDEISMTLWPPVILDWPIWLRGMCILFILIVSIVSGGMAFSFFVNAYNPAAFAPYQSRPAHTSWTKPQADKPDSTIAEYAQDDDEPMAPNATHLAVVERRDNGNPGTLYKYQAPACVNDLELWIVAQMIENIGTREWPGEISAMAQGIRQDSYRALIKDWQGKFWAFKLANNRVKCSMKGFRMMQEIASKSRPC